MDDLVKDRSLTGPVLVNSIRKLDSTLSIADVLEKTRYVHLKRVLEDLSRTGPFHTGYHVVQDLCRRGLTLEDVQTVLDWYGESSQDVRALIDSGSVPAVYKYMMTSSTNTKTSWWSRRLFPCTSSTRDTDQSP